MAPATGTNIGTVESLQGTYGFIRGKDGVSRFFLPRDMGNASFDDLRIGTIVEFVHIDHPRGPRAISITVNEGDHGDQG